MNPFDYLPDRARAFALVTLRVLTVVAGGLTLLAALLTAVAGTDTVADRFLALYPKHRAVMSAITRLEDMSAKFVDGQQHAYPAGVLSINELGWPEIVDFLQSEIARRKGELQPPTVSGDTASSEATQSPAQPGTPAPPISWSHIKTVTLIKTESVMAGSRPLTPQYNLIVFWPEEPVNVLRIAYEAVSLQEFELDIRRWLLDGLTTESAWATFIALLLTALGGGLQLLARPRKLLPTPAGA